MLKIPEVEEAFAQGKRIKSMVILMKKSKLIVTDFLREMYNATKGMDAVIASMILYGAYDGAEKQGIPCFYSLLNPAVPTREFPCVMAPHIPSFLNKVSHICLEKGFWICFKKACNRLRKTEWGLPKLTTCPIKILRSSNLPTLLGYSEAIIPKPKDWVHEIVTGYWQLEYDEKYNPDPELLQFISSSENPPIYIGFGSMPIGDVDQLLDMLQDALSISNQRAVVFLSYNNTKPIEKSERIFLTKPVPHNWLFSHVSATVIHGGAGTCAASMKAGIPTIVIPFMGDQTFWGEQIHKKGVGPKPVPFKKINSKILAELIKEAITSEQMKENARHLGESLQRENGSALAAAVIHDYLQNNQETKVIK
jgi:UDP:flavonoid glycosyltransferase YjiC (YdhE family)